jgi:hypothetical protein
MTNEEIDALEQLVNAATPAPWLLTTINANPRGLAMYQQIIRATDTGLLGGVPAPKITMQVQFVGGYKTRYASDGDILAHEPSDQIRFDAAFVAAARQAIPELIKDLREARAALDQIHTGLQKVGEQAQIYLAESEARIAEKEKEYQEGLAKIDANFQAKMAEIGAISPATQA